MLLICMCAVGLLVRARRTGGLGGGVRRPSPRGREGVEGPEAGKTAAEYWDQNRCWEQTPPAPSPAVRALETRKRGR